MLDPREDGPLVTVVGFGLFSLYFLWRSAKDIIHRRAFSKYTAVDELSVLGKPREGPRIAGTAVVAGGSLAGMYTAIACANHFEKVVIIEADSGADTKPTYNETKELPNGLKTQKSRRSRLWQAHALHTFQPYMLLALRRWFPNFDTKAKDNGHRINKFTYNMSISCLPLPSDVLTPNKIGLPKHPNIAGDEPIVSIWANRWNLEPFIRRLMLETYPNIKIVTGLASGLTLSAHGSVQSVTYTCAGNDKAEKISAALVVDCTGSTNSGVKWLSRAGLPPPSIKTLNPNLRYGSAFFKVPHHLRSRLPIPGGYDNAECFYSNVSDVKVGNRAVFGIKSDYDHIIIGFGGWGVTPEEIPRDPEQLKAFHRSVIVAKGAPPPPEWFCDVIDLLCEDDGWEQSLFNEYHYTSCGLVEYHKYTELPSNFIAVGDSVMRASPIYGLGSTKSCVGAATLEGMLHGIKGTTLPPDFSTKFMAKQHLRTEWSWVQSKAGDYCFPTTTPIEGETLEENKLTGGLVYRLFRICHIDPKTSARFQHGRTWLWPVNQMFTNWSVARAILYWLFIE